MPKFSSGYSNKTTPVDNDKVLIADSEASDAIKSVTLANLVANRIVAKLQSITSWITTAMIGDGQVTDRKSKNTIRFSAYRNANLNTTPGAFTLFPFDAENYDTGNNFASNTFTAPVAGLYHFTWLLTVDGATSRFQSRLTVNGVEYRRGTDDVDTTSTKRWTSLGAIPIPLAANDTVRIEYFNAAGTIPFTTGGQCVFEGYLVALT